MASPMHPRILDRATVALEAIAVVALSVWLAALPVLGAIVAPAVFRGVPMPFSADAMTTVFQRYDRVAVAAGLMLVGACAGLAVLDGAGRRRARAIGLAGAVSLLALSALQAAAVSTKIAALHRMGALRGLGPEGLELDRVHRVASVVGRVEVAVAVVTLVALLMARRRDAARGLLR